MKPLQPPFSAEEALVYDPLDTSQPQLNSPSVPTSDAGKPTPRMKLTLPIAYFSDEYGNGPVDRADNERFCDFLACELSLARLDAIQAYLWFASEVGTPDLGRELVMGRSIIVTEHADMHMVVHGSKCYMKPLPEFLLCHSMWTSYLCEDFDLYANAFGLLDSYRIMICRRSDFRLAQSCGLLPEEITWPQWIAFSHALYRCNKSESRHPWNLRYAYGKLSLARLDVLSGICKGQMYRSYGSLDSRGWLIGTVVYLTIVLTAMQVGLGTNRLSNNEDFQRASFGFTVFSIMAPVIIFVWYWANLIGSSLWQFASHARKNHRFKRRLIRNGQDEEEEETMTNSSLEA